MKILFITDVSIFPVYGGEKLRSYGLIKCLAKLGHSITVVAKDLDFSKVRYEEQEDVNFISYPSSNVGLLSNFFLSYYFKYNKDLIRVLTGLLGAKDFDLIIVDFFYISKYIPWLRRFNIPIILSTHNVESKLILQKPSSGFLKKIRIYQEYCFMRFHEIFYYKLADALVCVSDVDFIKYKDWNSSLNLHMIPNFLIEEDYLVEFEKRNQIVMTGNFNAYMNRSGLAWFFDNVWDDELDEFVDLVIVGKGSVENFKFVEKKFSNVKVVGSVDNILSYIGRSKAVIVPLLHGSGTRLKCLEAMAMGVTVISTSKGREGIVSESIIEANSPKEFKEAILNLSQIENFSNHLKNDFNSRYSLSSNMKVVSGLIESLKI